MCLATTLCQACKLAIWYQEYFLKSMRQHCITAYGTKQFLRSHASNPACCALGEQIRHRNSFPRIHPTYASFSILSAHLTSGRSGVLRLSIAGRRKLEACAPLGGFAAARASTAPTFNSTLLEIVLSNFTRRTYCWESRARAQRVAGFLNN